MTDRTARRIETICYVGVILLVVAFVLTACAKPDVCDLPPSTMDAGQGCYRKTLPPKPVPPVPPPAKPKATLAPTAAPAAAPTPFTGVRPIIVDGDQQRAQEAALGMFHALNLSRVRIASDATWTITGKIIDGDTIEWTIADDTGTVRGTVTQRGVTYAAAAAVAPGIMTYLPRL